MMAKGLRIVIVGAGEFASLAYEYFTRDTSFEVIAFSVEDRFLVQREMHGVPVVPFEQLRAAFNPQECKVFVAVGYSQLNRTRSRLCTESKRLGFSLASYVSSQALVWPRVVIGENSFVFEQAVIQPNAQVGNSVVVWSGCQILHRVVLADYCFLSSHVVIGGHARIGEYSFLGLNSCVRDSVEVARDCVIGAGSVVVKPTAAGTVCLGNPARPSATLTAEDFITGRRAL
jgi:sugar O-acyltransferase (sialic acid O-acetyltransferase NeuD family)